MLVVDVSGIHMQVVVWIIPPLRLRYLRKDTYVKNSTNSCVTSTWIAKKMATKFRADISQLSSNS